MIKTNIYKKTQLRYVTARGCFRGRDRERLFVLVTTDAVVLLVGSFEHFRPPSITFQIIIYCCTRTKLSEEKTHRAAVSARSLKQKNGGARLEVGSVKSGGDRNWPINAWRHNCNRQ
jgi:hypothetical protein